MRILFITTAHNSMSQRLLIELGDIGHDIDVCVASSAEDMLESMKFCPDLIVAPMLKAAIPEEIYKHHLCLIVHPGIKGDRGPSSIDWALVDGEKYWGATILQASAEFDAGAIWASHEFSIADDTPTKSRLYRGPVTEAAVRGVVEAIAHIESGEFQSGAWRPQPLSEATDARGRLRPPMKVVDRSVDWTWDDTITIFTKVRATDSQPGVVTTLLGIKCHIYGVHHEDQLRGAPGEVLAIRDGAVCIGTIDGALWISHLKAKDDPRLRWAAAVDYDGRADEEEFYAIAGVKLPATQVLGPLLHDVSEYPLSINEPVVHRTFREIVYTEENEIGYLAFNFYNGAMSTAQCQRLRDAFLFAQLRPTKVIVLLGGPDFWSNGIHLNTIEAAPDPAEESWLNINAIDDLIHEMINTMTHVVISGMRGNAGAGGTILALAADLVFARAGIVLNPHYRGMGGLYGSEYWTYLLPRRVGAEMAKELTSSCRPLGTRRGCEIGFLDKAFGHDQESFEAELRRRAEQIAQDPGFGAMLLKKHNKRLKDETVKPLSLYRAEELDQMRLNFFGPDSAYHKARRCFVFKGNPPPLPQQPQGEPNQLLRKACGLQSGKVSASSSYLEQLMAVD